MSVRLLPDRVHVEITDALPVLLPRDAAAEDASGRALELVDALSTGWGCVEVPTGKIVWFDVARERAASETAP